MHGNINLDLSFFLSDNGFSLDELVQTLKNKYEEEAFSELLQLILKLIQEILVARTLSGESSPFQCCGTAEFQLNGSYTSSVKTSIGNISLQWRRVKCKICNRNIVLLKDFMGLARHQRKTTELEQAVIDAASKDSYRRAVETLDATGFVRVPYKTARNWVMESYCDELDLSADLSDCLKTPVQVLADGTGFKGKPAKGSASKGDFKVVVGVNRTGEVFPVGSWAGIDWQSIKWQLKENKVDLGNGSVLVSYGEKAVAEFASYLEGQGYSTAANYIECSRRKMFSYIRRWLKYGVICTKASSLIERVIREPARRLEKVAYNWSNKEAGKIARIILKIGRNTGTKK